MTKRLVGLLVVLEEDTREDVAVDGIIATLHHLKGITAVEPVYVSPVETLTARALELRIRHKVIEDVRDAMFPPKTVERGSG